MRGNNDMVRIMRDILLDLDELKTVQPVGTNQIVAKPYDSGAAYDRQVTITAPFQSVGSSFKLMRITVIPTNLTPNNILLSEVIPELRYTNGTKISNWPYVASTGFGISKINSEDITRNTYLLFIVAPTNTVMRLKLWITANASVSFTIEDLI
jgi:hypothetical protein